MTEVAAFAELYAAHYRQVRGLCRQLLGTTERAEDAAQESFVRAYRALASRDPAQPFIAWIMRIARNHCLDLLRRRSRERALFGDEEVETVAAEAPGADGLGKALTSERAAAVPPAHAGRAAVLIGCADDRPAARAPGRRHDGRPAAPSPGRAARA